MKTKQEQTFIEWIIKLILELIVIIVITIICAFIGFKIFGFFGIIIGAIIGVFFMMCFDLFQFGKAIDNATNEYENKKAKEFELEQEKLAIERERLSLERERMRLEQERLRNHQ